MPKPTKPRYGCYNCLYGVTPRGVSTGEAPSFCTVCRVEDKDTVMPQEWKPREETTV